MLGFNVIDSLGPVYMKLLDSLEDIQLILRTCTKQVILKARQPRQGQGELFWEIRDIDS